MSEQPTSPRSGSYVSGESSTDPVVIETARKVRRVGYIIAVILILWLCLPVIYFTVTGMKKVEMWDPYTKLPVPSNNDYKSVTCERIALEWIENRKDGEPLPKAEVDQWLKGCASRYPELAQRVQK